jgi:hypothetical protein
MSDNCASCKEPLDHPSGEGCALMGKHDDKVGYLVIVDVIENGTGELPTSLT